MIGSPMPTGAEPPRHEIPVLEVKGLARSFGGVYAVSDVSMSVADGELRGVIGPNGAGKSTLFNLISGHLSPDRGVISYRGSLARSWGDSRSIRLPR